MRLTVKYRLVGVVFLAMIAVLIHLMVTQETVLISEKSPDKQVIAQLMAKNDFPYVGTNVYLVFRSGKNGEVIQKTLLMNRDLFSSAVAEVNSLSWGNHIVTLDIDSGHYHGPNSFSVPSP